VKVYSDEFIRGYRDILLFAYNRDDEKIIELSINGQPYKQAIASPLSSMTTTASASVATDRTNVFSTSPLFVGAASSQMCSFTGLIAEVCLSHNDTHISIF
jgi:hypothetical protein